MQQNSHLSVLIHDQAKHYGDREVMVYQDFGEEQWKSMSWNQMSAIVKQVSNAMLNMGVKPQENVGIFSQNSWQYFCTDFGAWGIRAITIPFYATSSEDQIHYMIDDAAVRFLFVGEQEQYDKAHRVAALCPQLERIIVFDRNVRISTHDHTALYFDDFLKMGEGLPRQPEVENLWKQASMDDIANILYTSGTTGASKGVILTYSQYHAAFEANHKAVTQLSEKDRVLVFLPYTHIFERGWDILCLTEGATLIVNSDPHKVQQTMKETHPTSMSSVPRFWEKVYMGVMEKIETSSAMRRKIFENALKVGYRHNIDYLSKGKKPPIGLALEYKMINKTIFSLVRKELGLENANIFPTAGAAVSPKVQSFTRAIGIQMVVGYGLTESLATVSCNRENKPYTLGSVGEPLDSIKIKFAEDGEVLLKGPTITRGYYKKEALNEQAFDEEGYFRTGDCGYMKDGELFLTERKKDLYKTSNGKYIAPQLVESKLLVDKYIDQVAVIADERKFVSALIIPEFRLIENWATERGISFESREDLCKNEEVNKMMAERIETLQQGLAHYEQIKRFTLLPHHFSMERGELTNTLKMKRPVIAVNYKKEIDKMYEE